MRANVEGRPPEVVRDLPTGPIGLPGLLRKARGGAVGRSRRGGILRPDRSLATALGRRFAAPLVVMLLVSAAGRLGADPFTEVPAGHWSYTACARLVELGWLPAERAATFSGKPQLTRFEFGVALLAPLSELDRAVAALPADADSGALLDAAARVLRVSPMGSENEIAQGASDLARLTGEFSDILRDLSFEPAGVLRALRRMEAKAIREWRARSLGPPPRASGLAPSGPATDTVRVPLGPGALALSYERNPGPPELLNYFAASAAERAMTSEGVGAAEPALRDPLISRLRTAYEYGLGPALTLSLAYEEIARRGQGLAPLDAAFLASFGIGYRLTPSTSLKLSYSLSKYSNYALETSPLRDRVAETAVSIGF